jgi:hypothetical protein
VDRNDGSYVPKLGDYLGDFTDEINPNDGNYIVEFVSAGPKNYSFALDTGKTFAKIKGLCLSYKTEEVINFETMKKIVIDKSEPIKVEQMNFKKDKKTWGIQTVHNKKIYQMVYDKRVLKNDFTTLPFGF